MSQSNQNQNINTQWNPLGDLWNSISNWGGNQDAMQPTQYQQPQPQPNAPGPLRIQAAMQNTMANSNTSFNPTFWDKMFGYQKGDVQYGAMAPGLLQGAGSIAQSILGWGQLSEGKRQNALAQDNWQKQYDNQATLTNASQRDRQSARVAAAPGAYQSVGEYMQQNKVG